MPPAHRGRPARLQPGALPDPTAAAHRKRADAYRLLAEAELLLAAAAERPTSLPAPQAAHDGQLYYTLGQAAQATGLSERTLGRWCQQGLLPAFQAGPRAKWHIARAGLEQIHELVRSDLARRA